MVQVIAAQVDPGAYIPLKVSSGVIKAPKLTVRKEVKRHVLDVQTREAKGG